MKLSIFKNDAGSAKVAPYVMTVSMKDEIIPLDNNFHIPIYLVQNAAGEGASYEMEICGFRLEAANPEDLRSPVGKLLEGLVNMARLPSYVFAASDSLFIYPVYTIGDEVFATTPGGPVFKHVELAEVRSYLGAYLHTMEELGTLGQTETLHVRGIDRNTLGLMRPVFYLKKRVPAAPEFWAPVFKSEDDRTIYTYAASAKREVPVGNGCEIIDLHALVSEALMKDGRLDNPYDLRSDRVFPADAKSLLEKLTVQPYQLNFQVSEDKQTTSLPVYRNGKTYVAAEHRVHENRYSIFLGSDPNDLLERVSFDLERRGKIDSIQDMQLLEID